MNMYTLAEKDIERLVEKTANGIFAALADEDIKIDIGNVTVQVELHIDGTVLVFNVKLQNRVVVSVVNIAPEDNQPMGFKV